MTFFDYAVIAIVLLSAALGIWRGFVYEIFALGAWISGIVCAFVFGQKVATWLTFNLDAWLKLVVAYALVFVAVFIAVSVTGFIFTKMIRAVGLSPVDRGLGAMFGIVRGVLIVTVIVFIASFSSLKQSDWWQQSASAKPFEVMAGLLRYRLPDSVTKHFKMSAVIAPLLMGEVGRRSGEGKAMAQSLSDEKRASLNQHFVLTSSKGRGEIRAANAQPTFCKVFLCAV